MKYYIIAGEASGDLHASNLIREIKKLDNEALFRAWGGDRMKEAGAVLVTHYHDLAFMGFTEVLLHLHVILKNISRCKKDLLLYNPDALILIDYPGFNMRMAEFARENNIKVFYYISPQVWAWKQSRVKKIKRFVDRMFVILPFEKDFYARYNYPVEFVGHPLLDAITPDYPFMEPMAFRRHFRLDQRPVIALLPGSRKQEISRILKTMTAIAGDFSGYQFVVGGVSSSSADIYKNILKNDDTKIIFDHTYDLVKNAHAAIVASGTATLETALLGTPQVICYRGGYLSFQIAKRLVDVKFIGLVNLIMDKAIVKELIQNDFNRASLKAELHRVIHDETYRTKILEEYKELAGRLGGPGASYRTASRIVADLKRTSPGKIS
jgi:lipid-A-disaccharide synthase